MISNNAHTQKSLKIYLEALKNTRETYLALIRRQAYAVAEQNKIWAVSLILQYKIEQHKKYLNLLDFLMKDPEAKEALQWFFSQLASHSNEPLEDFISKAYILIESEEFNSQISKLKNSYLRTSLLYLLGSLVFFTAAILSAAYLTPIIGLWSLALVVFDFMVVRLLLGGLRMTVDKESNFEVLFRGVKEKVSTFFRFSETLTYETNDGTVNIQYTHHPQQRTALKQGFFQPQLDHEKPLSEEVKDQFDLHLQENASIRL